MVLIMINYPLALDSWSEDEIKAINRVIESDRFTIAFEVEEFEKEFAEFFKTKHAIMVNSGSSANLVAIASLILSVEIAQAPSYKT